jgi:hypothetical protein
MYPVLTQQLAAEHIAELRQQAARRRLTLALRRGPGPATSSRRGGMWGRRPFRQARPTPA